MTERHLLGLSGGKDSAALAVYMKEKYPHLPMEYVFIDSGYELPETYAYIKKIEAVLGIKIIRVGGTINNSKNFLWWLKNKDYYLPSPKNRWCTELLKLKPLMEWTNNNCSGSIVHNYVGLRADEKRVRLGFKNSENLINHHPFVENGLIYNDIKNILEGSGLGFPEYYKWRSRSGCYFCFYQSKKEWIGLYKNHPDLFKKASDMERTNKNGKKFTWNDDISLKDLVLLADIIENTNEPQLIEEKKHNKLVDIMSKCINENR